MLNYANVDRATGKVLAEKGFEAKPPRDFDETHVWLPMVVLARPAYDEMEHKLVQYRRPSEDISDLNVDVGDTVQLVQGYDKVALDATEKQERKDNKIKESDFDLTRIIEDLMVLIATGATLDRAAFPPQVWAKVNKRRKLRGNKDV
jgi:hypothetical protein